MGLPYPEQIVGLAAINLYICIAKKDRMNVEEGLAPLFC